MASIQKRPDGRWRARYRDTAGREHAKHFARKLDAQRWLDEVTTSVVTGTYVDPRAGAVTVRAYFRDWSARQLWETGTRESMNLAIRQAPFSDHPLRAVKRSDVESWVKAMDTAGLAPLTVHQRVQSLRSVFRAAIRDRLLMEDPSVGVVLPRKRRREVRLEIPSPEAVGALYGAAEDWFRPFVALCAFAGLRFGEANGVQLGDVDFLRRKLLVRRQVQREAPHPLEVRAPKYGSERDVDLPDELLELLAHHVETVGVYGEERWIFPGRAGGPIWPRTLAYQWDKTTKAAGVTGVTVHGLRHFYASGLIASGCDPATVQRALGHASPAVTLNTYTHLWPKAEERTRAAAAGLMRSALDVPADSMRTESPTSA